MRPLMGSLAGGDHQFMSEPTTGSCRNAPCKHHIQVLGDVQLIVTFTKMYARIYKMALLYLDGSDVRTNVLRTSCATLLWFSFSRSTCA